jgi:hypothetical protein
MLVDVVTALVIVGAVMALCAAGIHFCRRFPEWSDS